MRNRNIIILARMEVKIKSLTLGHAGSAVHGKPRITNQVRCLLASDMAARDAMRLRRMNDARLFPVSGT